MSVEASAGVMMVLRRAIARLVFMLMNGGEVFWGFFV